MDEKEIVIEFKNVTKSYKLFKNDRQRFKAIFSKKANYKRKIAVNDVSFQIRRGESVALFGKNGAGKSTILKMITGVAYPTSGQVIVNGRVSALLEPVSYTHLNPVKRKTGHWSRNWSLCWDFTERHIEWNLTIYPIRTE